MVFRHDWHPDGYAYDQPEPDRSDSVTCCQDFLRRVDWGALCHFAALSNSDRCQKLLERCRHSLVFRYPAGRVIMRMVGVFTEFECAKLREHTKVGSSPAGLQRANYNAVRFDESVFQTWESLKHRSDSMINRFQGELSRKWAKLSDL